MNDPYLIETQALLKTIDQAASPYRKRAYPNAKDRANAFAVRGALVVCTLVACFAVLPWGSF